jgi:hypothetical protein
MRNDIPTEPFPYLFLKTNITFGELQEMSYDDCASFVDRMRNELLELWNDGIPPYVGIEMKEIISRFKKLNEYDISEFYIEDELYNDYDGFIRNFTKIATSVNQFFPTILKSRINGYSIYDYLSNENLWSDFRYTIVQKVRFDKMYSFSKYWTDTFEMLIGGDIIYKNESEAWEYFKKELFYPQKWEWEGDYSPWVDAIKVNKPIDKTKKKYLPLIDKGKIGFWFEDWNFNKKNEELGRMRFSREFVDKLDLDTKYPQYTDNRRGFNPNSDEEYYALRFYYKQEHLFPKIFQVLRLGLGQVATNFPPLTARWIYEKYLPPLSREECDDYYSSKFGKPKVFDSSAGWGGRLLGSLCSNYPIHYIGLDVNQSNKGCYEALGEFYNTKCGREEHSYGSLLAKEQREYEESQRGDFSFDTDGNEDNREDYIDFSEGAYPETKERIYPIDEPNTFEIHYKGSEVIGDDKDFMDKHKGDVDLCFTSPPYFNKELYSDDEEQSSIKFPNYDDWLKGFLEPTIKTYYDLLKENRYCLINIADLKIGENQFHPLEQDTISLAIKNGFQYIGKLGMVMTRMVGLNPTDGKNYWFDMKTKKTLKTEPILIFLSKKEE